MKKFTIIGLVLLSMLLITGCGSTQPLMAGGEYQEPGFFSGIFGGLLWPLSLIFMELGKYFLVFVEIQRSIIITIQVLVIG
jgi:hypothetical protein